MIAQIDEQQAAVIAHAMNPPGEPNIAASISDGVAAMVAVLVSHW